MWFCKWTWLPQWVSICKWVLYVYFHYFRKYPKTFFFFVSFFILLLLCILLCLLCILLCILLFSFSCIIVIIIIQMVWGWGCWLINKTLNFNMGDCLCLQFYHRQDCPPKKNNSISHLYAPKQLHWRDNIL